jgi:microsomal prostaglandin-E synthase 1
MDIWLNNPAFVAYAIMSVALTLNLIGLWAYSGVVRARTKTAINPEDGARFGAPVVEVDPPPVARVLRAHSNAQAVIYPFLVLGLVFVIAGGNPFVAKVVFGIFTVARFLHSFAYLAGKQPWRTVFFVPSVFMTILLIGNIVSLVLQGAQAPH